MFKSSPGRPDTYTSVEGGPCRRRGSRGGERLIHGRHGLVAVLGLALATLLGVALSGVGDAPAPIRIGVASRPGLELLQLAQEKNLFAREGASVRLVEFPCVKDARRAYERGQIDGLAGTLVELALLRSAGSRPPVGFLLIDNSRGGDALLARPGIPDLSSLRGRRIALEPETAGSLLLARALASADLGPGDVVRVPLDHQDAARALADGDVDAVVSHPPYSVAIERHDEGRVLFSSAQMPAEIVDLLMIDPAVLDARPKEAAGIVRALGRAVRRTEVRPADAYRLMGRAEGLSSGEMREALESGFELVPIASQAALLAPGGPLERTLESVGRALRASGEMSEEARAGAALTPAVVESAARG